MNRLRGRILIGVRCGDMERCSGVVHAGFGEIGLLGSQCSALALLLRIARRLRGHSFDCRRVGTGFLEKILWGGVGRQL